MKMLHIFGGANGSGKTTIADAFCKYSNIRFINADNIAADIRPAYSGNVDLEASRIFIENLRSAIKHGFDFAIESTLSSKSLHTHIKYAKAQGYCVVLYYIFLDDSDLAISRVRTRAAKGGHSVPDETVVRRMKRSLKNFTDVYSGICSHWHLYYNGGIELVAVANFNKKLEILDSGLYSRFTEIKNENV